MRFYSGRRKESSIRVTDLRDYLYCVYIFHFKCAFFFVVFVVSTFCQQRELVAHLKFKLNLIQMLRFDWHYSADFLMYCQFLSLFVCRIIVLNFICMFEREING